MHILLGFGVWVSRLPKSLNKSDSIKPSLPHSTNYQQPGLPPYRRFSSPSPHLSVTHHTHSPTRIAYLITYTRCILSTSTSTTSTSDEHLHQTNTYNTRPPTMADWDTHAALGGHLRDQNATAEKKPKNEHRWIWFVTGPTACGKTTVAKALAKNLNFTYVEGDDVSLHFLLFSSFFFSCSVSLSWNSGRWGGVVVVVVKCMHSLHGVVQSLVLAAV